ncbi:MAG: CRTAC1 family protein, partial [Calditrichaeota bacterium]
KYGLDQWPGWWNGVTTGDFDEDGRLDIVATNWGLNTKYHGRFSREHPLRLYYADFDLNGTMDLIEAYFDPNLQKIVPERRLMDMARALPFIRMRMPTHKQYALSSIQEIIGPRLKSAHQLQANTLAHMVFLNRGDSFEAHPLPAEAQWAPAFYVGVADFDGDGHEDLFLSQNFFAYQVETSRSDAGRGLWLKGDGQGNFQAVSGQVSGVKVYGEQRGAALADFDRDGRIDLVVTQNGNQTRLFHNVKARPGLSIQLQGPPDNPKGVGAKIRLIYAGSQGPVREIHAGAGYLSQDSPVQILGYREKPVKVQVQWPGSKTTEVNLTKTANYLIIGMNGLISSN